MSPMTTSDVKKNNKQALLRHIYENESSQQQVLCELLHLSRPTVINLIRECSEEGLIEKSGYYESTGGRKANAIVLSRILRSPSVSSYCRTLMKLRQLTCTGIRSARHGMKLVLSTKILISGISVTALHILLTEIKLTIKKSLESALYSRD